jgi:G3E family GTPase
MSESKKRLPVTLLSGFLGAGKTTLLKAILRSKSDMKIAIIVNDMGSINFDADEMKNSKLVQEKVVNAYTVLRLIANYIQY